ncbi:restriction endonuclease subunit S [Micromonospora sp. LOL_014]|uniref:restriction endonuclease subunit S n=1 Tax=Micromonospora sp. LOL_014 TaxID=3345415 RepID=UPI003A83C4FD
MSEWRTYTVGDIAEVFDGPHATPKKTDSGPWFLSISSLDSGRLKLSESAHISEEDFERWTRRVTPTAGDVLFSYETRLGEAALMPDGIRAALGRRMGLLRPHLELVEQKFLLLAYLSPEFQQVIHERRISGATVDRIPLVELPRWPIRIPDLATQKRISATLGTLDDKIAVNDRVTRTAWELMKSHYEKALLTETRHATLGDVAAFSNNRRVPLSSREREARIGPYPYYGAAGVVGYVDAFIFSGPHLLVGEDGSVITPEGRPVTQYAWGDFWVNNHAHVLTGTTISTELLSIALTFTNVASLITGAVQPKLSMSNLRRLEVPLPNIEAIARLEPVSDAIQQLVRSKTEESRRLAALRDVLLPELMSGRLRVKDAEKVVEEAV